MAENKKANPEPIVPDDIVKRLKELEPELEKAKKGLELLKELGISAPVLEKNIEWSEKVKNALLKYAEKSIVKK